MSADIQILKSLLHPSSSTGNSDQHQLSSMTLSRSNPPDSRSTSASEDTEESLDEESPSEDENHVG